MQLELKDVLHHHLGCVIQTPEGLGNFIAMYARGDMPVVCDNTVQSDWNVEDVKPVLWRLENLTHEQRNEISKRYMDSVGSHHSAAAWFKMVRNDANTLIYLLKRHYDVFGLIARGLAVDASTLSSNPYAVQKTEPGQYDFKVRDHFTDNVKAMVDLAKNGAQNAVKMVTINFAALAEKCPDAAKAVLEFEVETLQIAADMLDAEKSAAAVKPDATAPRMEAESPQRSEDL